MGSEETHDLPVLDSVLDYEKLYRIGEGTYGVVYKARDRLSGEIVALKKVRFEHSRDGVPVTSIRELRVLQSCHHPAIVQLKQVVTGSKADSLFLVFEYCEHDLGRLVDQLQKPFSLSEIKCLVKQLLEAVAFLHDRWIMHRFQSVEARQLAQIFIRLNKDIKMSNLLYNSRGELKLCDFGLARYFAPFSTAMTPRVVTLWYRAPEVLLGSETYDEAVDMWAVGCVLGELLRMAPLFPADGELECIRLHCNLLGAPNARIWPGLAELPAASQIRMPDQPYNQLRRTFPSLSDHGIDLLNGLLTYDPRKRLTARQALKHSFFAEKPYPKQARDMPTFPSSHTSHGEGPSKRPRAVAAEPRAHDQGDEEFRSAATRHRHQPAPGGEYGKRPRVAAGAPHHDAEMDRRFGEAFGGGDGGRPGARRVAVVLPPQHSW